MKRIFVVIIFLMVIVSNLDAGNAGNMMAGDILLGTTIFSAFGTLLSLPSYMQGGSQNLTVLYVGAGYGALIGAGIGFCYGIFDIIRSTEEKKELPKQKGMLYNNDDICISLENLKLTFIKKF